MSIRGMSDVESLLQSPPKARELHAIWECRQPIANFDQARAYKSSGESMHIPWLDDLSLAQKFTLFLCNAVCAAKQ